jgi:hypothetical protein
MTEEVNSPETTQVQEYGLPEFLKKIQHLVKQGFELDLDSNLNYPQQYGTMFTAGMIQKSTTEDTSAMRYMEGYTAGKEWGLANANTVVPLDAVPVTAEGRVVEGGGLVEVETLVKVDGRTKQVKAK